VRRWFARLAARTRDEPRRATSIAAALEFCRQVLPRRAVLFLISDFLDEGYLQVLRHANRKHDVVAALITDPREAEMPPTGLVTLEDAETGRLRLVDTRSSSFRSELAARAQDRQKTLRDQLRATGMDLVVFDAAGSMVDPLLRFFRERERRLRR
jgi:23S rRNA U2552 (ribose-2'-O)-methylase RlmE/FtsJ